MHRERRRTAIRLARIAAAPAPGTGETCDDDARKFYQPKFPTTVELAATVKGIRSQFSAPSWDGHEGTRARMLVSAGSIRIGYRNHARRERTGERAAIEKTRRVHDLAVRLEVDGHFPAPPVPRQVITEWSRKSRNNMRECFTQLDYEPFFESGHVPAMVTTTYPGPWEIVAPNGRTVKKHMALFRRRFERAWGISLRAIWKLEFQRRGAPHLHMMMVPPHGRARRGRYAGKTFKPWLSHTWANIVGHPDPEHYARNLRSGTRIDYADGMRASDPQRVATYFAKHGSFRAKEYQHNVPELWQQPGDGPGRFWGYWNLRRVVHGVELWHADAALLARTLRRYARAQGVTYEIPAPRFRGGKLVAVEPVVIGLSGAQELDAQPPYRSRSVRRRVKRMRGKYGAGWLATNNGPRLASALSRYLAIIQADLPSPEPPPAPDHPPGMCRECGEPRRRHRCSAWVKSREDRQRSRPAPSFA